jgi:hypothetical protein
MDKKILIELGIAVLILFIVYKLLQKIGLISDGSSEAAAEFGGKWYFSPQNKIGDKLTGYKFAIQEARKLHDAKGIFNDNEEAIYGVFRRLGYQSELVGISYWFAKTYNADLFEYLNGFLSDKDLIKIYKIVESKPKGR